MNLLKAIRRISKNRIEFIINSIGLGIAFTCLLLVASYVRNELSYDRFHIKSDRIYRLTSNSNTGISSMIDARLQSNLSENLLETLPEIEDIVRLNSYRNAIISIDEEVFYSKKIFAVDSSFFNVFSFDLVLGDKEKVFNEPGQVVLSETLAQKYFGTTQIIGKKIEIIHQKYGVAEDYTIKGIIEDAPQNSHFKYDMLTSKEQSRGITFDFTYLLLNANTSVEHLEESIQAMWDEKLEEGESRHLAGLQSITDIHLESDKSREMERNGNYLSIWLLISGIIIILVIAFINYSNLNFVQFIKDIKMHQVKMINGAQRKNLVGDSVLEAMLMLVVVMLLSFGFAEYISREYQFMVFGFINPVDTFILIVLFSSFVIINAIWPFFTYGYKNMGRQDNLKQRKSYKYFVIFQISLAFIALGSILIIQNQLKYIDKLHPNGSSTNMIAMPNNSFDVVNNFDAYKERLLQYPEILDASAVLEEPAGTVTDNFPFEIQGMENNEYETINILSVDSNFFGFFNIQPIAGKTSFTNQSDINWEINAMRVWNLKQRGEEVPAEMANKVEGYRTEYIINKTALNHLGFTNANEAIGKKFRFNFLNDLFPFGEIIGVVDDFHYTNLYTVEKPLVIVNRKLFTHCFLIKIDETQTAKALEILREEWKELNPGFPFNYEFLSDAYQKVYRKEYELAKVLNIFGLVSVFLAAIGLFAMVSFNLERRTKEIGLRKINGATVSEVILMLFKSYSIWVLISLVIGAPFIYLLMNKWLESFAYSTTIDIGVFLQAGLFTWFIALSTVSIISLRTALKNPVESIRYE